MAKLSVLISYSNTDQQIAERVLRKLQSNNISCWVAFEDIKPSESWPAAISDAIKGCDIFMLILTENSNTSRQVIRELTQADNHNKKLYCFQTQAIDISKDLQYFFSSIQRREAFKSGFENALNQMVDDITLLLSQISKPSVSIPRIEAIGKPSANEEIAIPKIDEEEEEKLWKFAVLYKTKERYTNYLNKYPEGKYKDEANKNLFRIAEVEKQQQKEEVNEIAETNSKKKKIWIAAGIITVILVCVLLFRNDQSPDTELTSTYSDSAVQTSQVNLAADSSKKKIREEEKKRPKQVFPEGDRNINLVDDENKVFSKVENEAEFPGGNAAWSKYLEKALGGFNPADNGARPGKYRVIVKFIVSKDGSISDVTAETSFGYGMETQAVNCIKKGPKWKPALQNGRNVNAYRIQPITFIVEKQ